MLGADLAGPLQLRTTLWVLGEEQRRMALALEGYDRVVDLLEGFAVSSRQSDTSRALADLDRFEELQGGSCFHQDALLDRDINRKRWPDAATAQFASHLLRAMDRELDDLEPYAAFGETNSLAYRLAYRRLARTAPYLTILEAWLLNDRFLVEDTMTWSWRSCREEHARLAREGIPAETHATAKSLLESLVAKRYTPPGLRRAPRGPEPWLHKLQPARVAQALAYLLRGDWRDSNRIPRTIELAEALPTRKIARRFRERRLTRAFDRLAAREVPRDRPYACYFLHVQPEYSIEGLAAEYQDQVALIRTLAAALPAGMRLLVKEHRPMVGRRPPSFYDELSAVPNTRLISDAVHSQALVEGASLVATLTGTVGIEALCHGKPVLVFGNTFYSGRTGADFAGVHTVYSLPDLAATITTALSPAGKPSREDAVRTIAAMYGASHPGKVGSTYTMSEMREPANRALLAAGLAAEVKALRARHSRADGVLRSPAPDPEERPNQR